MLSVYFRSFAKIWVFIFCIFFIIFFIVYGYRYNRNIGFIQKNVYIEFKFWEKHQSIYFGWYLYTTEDNYLRLYNIESWCYNISYDNRKFRKCFEENKYFHDVFVRPWNDKPLWKDYNWDFEKIEYLTFSQNTIKNWNFSSEIQNAFRYKDINFVQSNNELFGCNDDFSICKYIKPVSGDPIGGTKTWLIYYEKENGYKLVWLR